MAKHKIVITVPKKSKNGNNGSNGNGMDLGGNGSTVGLSLLGSISAFSIWSAVNPSFFTINAFMEPKNEKHIRFGMNVGVVLNLVLSGGLYMAFGKRGLFPAIVTAATGGGLWIMYDRILKKNLHE